MNRVDQKIIWQALAQIPDPEIPAVTLADMGILRALEQEPDGTVSVHIAPTFSGCPALEAIRQEIAARLRELGINQVEVRTVLSPPWTTDWISEEGRRKLKSVGLAPPPKHGGDFTLLVLEPVVCPYCDSENTSIRNQWGPTPCRMIFYCNNCQQPFEQFKPL